MTGGWRLGAFPGCLELLAQLGNGAVLLLKPFRRLVAGNFLLAHVLLQALHFGLVLGHALVVLCRLAGGTRG
jgi:hypothetical protein